MEIFHFACARIAARGGEKICSQVLRLPDYVFANRQISFDSAIGLSNNGLQISNIVVASAEDAEGVCTAWPGKPLRTSTWQANVC